MQTRLQRALVPFLWHFIKCQKCFISYQNKDHICHKNAALNLLQVIHNSGFQKRDDGFWKKPTICVPQKGDLHLASGIPRASPWMHAWWQSEMPSCKDGRGDTSCMCRVTVISFTHPLPAHVANSVVVKATTFIAPTMCHISRMCI